MKWIGGKSKKNVFYAKDKIFTDKGFERVSLMSTTTHLFCVCTMCQSRDRQTDRQRGKGRERETVSSDHNMYTFLI